MGKLFKDNYASTYVAKNVKQALDKLIDVLQSREHVRKLVIGGAQTPRKPSKHRCKAEAPAAESTPMWTPMSKPGSCNLEKASTSTSVSENCTVSSSSDHCKRKLGSSRRSSDSCSSHVPVDSEKTSSSSVSEHTSARKVQGSSCSGGSRRSCSDSSSHLPIEWYYQMWEKGLRDYGCDGEQARPAAASHRHKSAVAPKVEGGWSSAPCKPGYLHVFEDTLMATKLVEVKGGH